MSSSTFPTVQDGDVRLLAAARARYWPAERWFAVQLIVAVLNAAVLGLAEP